MQLGRDQRDVARSPAPRPPRAACSSSSTGSCPASSDRHDDLHPGDVRRGSASSHRPAPRAGARWPRRGEHRARDSSTPLGAPVEPDVSTTDGSGSSASSQPRQPRRPRGVRRPARDSRDALGHVSAVGPGGLLESSAVATPPQWIAGARPRTLPAAVAPVLAGTGVAAYVDERGLVEGAARPRGRLALQVGGQLRQRLLRRHPRHRRRPGRPAAAGRLRARRRRVR